ncbi:MAG TPA: PQQ-dependent sugar dehydrogenase [Pyrinomonadaceae bacterium]|nr:PQQ-dependent sugar dehydrogenase [Pyrinomonadaceae bacterium]
MKILGFWAVLFSTVLAINSYGQGAPAPYTMRLQTFLTGTSSPVLLRSAKDGSRRLFIVQQGGIIRVLQPGTNAPTDFINLTTKVLSGGERGLLGLTFHPQFATNGKFYVDYTRSGDGATIIAEYKTTTGNGGSNTGDINSERILLTIPQPFSNHNGGMVEFGPDGYLYIGMGDGGSANDPGARAQNTAQLLGKMLRIDVNIPQGSTEQYLIPPTNPFTGAGTVKCPAGSTSNGSTCQEIYTVGMRNPWRWSFDRGGTNQLWIADVGQGAIEEVDIGTSGANYGWRVYEGTQCTNNDPTLCNPTGFTFPIFQYSHTAGRCSITGGYVYRGGQNNLPNGAYVYADYCTGEIWRWDGAQQILLQDTPRSIISFGEDEDGEVYVCYSNGQIDKITRARASADFDGDFKTDVSVFRPSTGVWYINHSSNNSYRIQGFGASGDIPTPEDYDGDNISDIGVFRPSTGTWYHYLSSNNTVGIIQFGAAGDVPAAGDYDGDAKADFAVYRPSTGTWYRVNTSTGTSVVQQFGLNGDVPVPGDYDGDGRYDISLWRPSNGTWYRLNSTNPSFTSVVQFGAAGDIPAQGDFDGDFKTDQAVFRNGAWYVLNSSNGSVQITNWGLAGDVPTVGDYDGDGRDDIGVFRPSNGVWYVIRSSNGSFLITQFGLNGDLAAPNYDAP